MRSNSITAAIRFLLYFVTLRSLAWSSRSREHALTRLTRAEGADGHGDGAGNVTLHRSDSLHSTSHVAEPAEGSVRPHPLSPGSSSTTAYPSNRTGDTASSSRGTSQGNRGRVPRHQGPHQGGTRIRETLTQRNLRPEEPRSSRGTSPPHHQEEPHRFAAQTRSAKEKSKARNAKG